MCFPRKASLGRYTGTRTQWRRAYRDARLAAANGLPPDPANSGLNWKAGLIVAYDRPALDPLACPVHGRLAAHRFMSEIITEHADLADSTECFSPGWDED